MRKLLCNIAVCLGLSACTTPFLDTSFMDTSASRTPTPGYSNAYVVNQPFPMPAFDSVIFTPLQNLAGESAPLALLRVANGSISDALRNQGFSNQGQAPLYMDGFVLHADDGSVSKDVLVRIRLMDAATWQIILEANVVGKVDATNRLTDAGAAIGPGVATLLRRQ